MTVKTAWALVLLGIAVWLYAESPYPQIERLNRKDILFGQLISDRDRYYTASESGSSTPSLKIYRYQPESDFDYFHLTGTLGSQDAFLTLNRLSSPVLPSSGRSVLLANLPGLFVYAAPETALERLIYSNRLDDLDQALAISLNGDSGTETVFFFPGEQLDSTERFFFLSDRFAFPLEDFRITDRFGPRIYPLSGKASFHKGIDLAAPLGSPVSASRSGTVTETGEHTVYGRYIIITHNDRLVSLYGHLSEIRVEKGRIVKTGDVIGVVGETGQTTGPHLHFEIREAGQAVNPGNFLPAAGL